MSKTIDTNERNRIIAQYFSIENKNRSEASGTIPLEQFYNNCVTQQQTSKEIPIRKNEKYVKRKKRAQ